jgi:hypothetical protein
MMNSGICFAFGFAFSIRLWRLSGEWPRVVGVVFAVLFLILALFRGCGPAVQETAVQLEMADLLHWFRNNSPMMVEQVHIEMC